MTAEDYMRQACHTTHDYMLRAAADIDAIFGVGYAAAHPDLVGQYIRTAAQDFHTAIISQQSVENICGHMGEISTAINGLAEATAEATMAAARHLGTSDAATPMGALEHVAKELKDGLGAVAEALGSMTVAPDPDCDSPFHVQVWGTDHCGEQIHTVRVKHGNDL